MAYKHEIKISTKCVSTKPVLFSEVNSLPENQELNLKSLGASFSLYKLQSKGNQIVHWVKNIDWALVWDGILAPLLINDRALGISFNFSKPHFPHMWNRIILTELLWG